MKQRITLDQILSLKPEGLDRLEEWVEPRGYTLMLTLGQMIDFLNDQVFSNRPQDYLRRAKPGGGSGWLVRSPKGEYWGEELRTALWEACKNVLERKEDDL